MDIKDYEWFNPKGHTLKEIIGAELEDIRREGPSRINSLRMATAAFMVMSTERDLHMIVKTLRPLTGLDFKTSAEFIEYMLKTLSYDDYLNWAEVMLNTIYNFDFGKDES